MICWSLIVLSITAILTFRSQGKSYHPIISCYPTSGYIKYWSSQCPILEGIPQLSIIHSRYFQSQVITIRINIERSISCPIISDHLIKVIFIFLSNFFVWICLFYSIKLLLIILYQRKIIPSMSLHLSCILSSCCSYRLKFGVVHPTCEVKTSKFVEWSNIIEGTTIDTKIHSIGNKLRRKTKIVDLKYLFLFRIISCGHKNIHSISLLFYLIIDRTL